MNLKISGTQLPQAPINNEMRPLTDDELNAIVGGVRVIIRNKKGEEVVIEM